MRSLRIAIVSVFAMFVGAGDALAVVGRPLTPVSYAGVARRTTRRNVAATSYAQPTTVVVAPVTALPAGCARAAGGGAVVYSCGGGVRYQPYYDGPTVVYRQI
jgi:hypothetical protein